MWLTKNQFVMMYYFGAAAVNKQMMTVIIVERKGEKDYVATST